MSEPAPRAVFLSYASQDATAAASLATALRAEGVEVWFDQDELRGGEAWDAKIKKQIRECALFVPVISANTQARPEGYFRLEWHLAEQRSLLIARGRPFVVPVCLDATTEGDALVPEAFLAVQWTRLPNGATTPAFVAQVKRLLAGGAPPVGSGSVAVRSGSVAPAGKSGVHPEAPGIPDYELLRQIGRGAYGDVWLARGLTGAYRAIKIVWRDRFDDPAPYYREFRGVKEAMGISLEVGQLPLLHIGQDEAVGYFYYVMELADDVRAGRTIDPERYAPLTLKELKARHGRLPAAQCLEFAEILAQALAALHSRGLVHRDIKPSNVVIVHGRPTLADIGLLATADDAKTYVGTQGYLAPEGPGSMAGDVFALGRLLYELATGFDREQFPRLPADVTDRAERTTLFELNEILLRAGEPLAQNRYHDATAMLADLRTRRSRKISRRRWWRGLGVAAGLAVALLVWWQLRPAVTPPTPPVPAVLPAAPILVAPANSIALLPFENLSDDKTNAYFVSGLQEDLLTNLASVRTLKVISQESASLYRGTTKNSKQVGAELGARYILTGSVRREAGIVRVAAKLIDAQADQQVWAKRFERESSQVLTLQAALADEIITALQPTLAPGEKVSATRELTTSAAAYDLYLKAKSDETDLDTGEELVRQALALDPNFVRAWVLQAMGHRLRYFNVGTDPTPERLALAEQAIGEARRLAPDDPEVLIEMGQIRQYCYRDYDGAIALFRQVLATHPNYAEAHRALAFLYRRSGHWSESLAEWRETWRSAPENAGAASHYLELMIAGRRYAEVREWLKTLQHAWLEDRFGRFNMATGSFLVTESEAELDRWWAAIPANEREQPEVIDWRFKWAFVAGNEPLLLDLIQRYGINWQHLDAGALLLYRGKQEQLRIYLDKLKPEFDKTLPTRSQTARGCVEIAKYHALRGERSEALAAIDRARQFKVESYDVWNGRDQAAQMVEALAWLGEKDAALAEIERLVRLPGGFGRPDLTHYITFISLHDDPRYQAILADPKIDEPLF